MGDRSFILLNCFLHLLPAVVLFCFPAETHGWIHHHLLPLLYIFVVPFEYLIMCSVFEFVCCLECRKGCPRESNAGFYAAYATCAYFVWCARRIYLRAVSSEGLMLFIFGWTYFCVLTFCWQDPDPS